MNTTKALFRFQCRENNWNKATQDQLRAFLSFPDFEKKTLHFSHSRDCSEHLFRLILLLANLSALLTKYY